MRLFVSLVLAGAVAFCFPHEAAAKGDKKKKDKGTADASAGPTPPKYDVPIPIHHKAEGVTLPYFDDKGKLQMHYKIASALRVDNDHLQMAQVQVETFDENGKTEMKIDMPSSVLDLNTRIVTSETPVTIRRSDFEVTGERMRFNSETRTGVMLGKVRMLIYNRDEMSQKKTP